jgi:hypothetical protein
MGKLISTIKRLIEEEKEKMFDPEAIFHGSLLGYAILFKNDRTGYYLLDPDTGEIFDVIIKSKDGKPVKSNKNNFITVMDKKDTKYLDLHKTPDDAAASLPNYINEGENVGIVEVREADKPYIKKVKRSGYYID